ncbi:hypothetical protein ACFVTP_27710 [Streptomyces celluloflavus]|uniref:hypothetical protein n=1 Tax=Streptomyces celluloflavus TaxID=58344 RepID=UPI0036DD7E33
MSDEHLELPVRREPSRRLRSAATVLALVATGAVVLAGCGPDGSGGGSPANGGQGSRTATAQPPGAGTSGPAASGGGNRGGGTGGGGSADGGTGGGSGGPSWVIDFPEKLGAYPLDHHPTADARQKMHEGLGQVSGQLGVNGTEVNAIYDDAADEYWVVITGMNGKGYDPSKLVPTLQKPPSVTDDGAGTRTTQSWTPADPGPHGGAALCHEELLQSGRMAVESTACVWETTTTLGTATLYPKQGGTRIKMGYGAKEMGGWMRKIRPVVEHHT